MGLPRIERLSSHHKKLLGDFRNQEKSLSEYISRYAVRHMSKDYLSWTFLAIDNGNNKLAGYFSLAVVSVERTSVQEVDGLSKLPRFPIPGILLARLAVDERVQGQGLGRYLFEQALGEALKLGVTTGPIRFRLFVADAINEKAESFYAYFGLKSISMKFPKRMVLDLKPIFDEQKKT
jgi:GNAT superfamily N-acetyltransferase